MKNKAKTDGNRSKLINHNTIGYLDDLNHICKLRNNYYRCKRNEKD
nr:MAG TPA: hypothetical protein [Bacteriophage sp.]